MPHHNPPLALQTSTSSSSLPQRMATWISRLAGPSHPEAPLPACPEALLQRLLDRHPQARQAFPSLAAVENRLRTEGRSAVCELPPDTLKKARAELLSVLDASDASALLSLMEPRHPASSFQVSRPSPLPPAMAGVEVSEGTEEDFLAAQRAWERGEPTTPAHLRD